MKTFNPGKAVMTERVKDKYWVDPRFRLFVNISVGRHLDCDWGDISEEDKQLNDAAIKDGTRIFSVYKRMVHNEEEIIWIITEADRSTTTILFSDEY